MTSKKRPSPLSVALLIAGAAVGAGILGLPVQTGMAGALPALIALSLMWLVSLTTSWVIADSYLRGGNAQADLASIYQHEIGAWGKWLTVVGYLINYYGIMVAYLAGSAAVLSTLLDIPQARTWMVLAFFVVATAVCIFGLDLVRRFNTLLMVVLLATLGFLLLAATRNLDPGRFAYTDWAFLPSTLPVITCSLAFQNMVPMTCRQLGGKRPLIFRALLMGSLIPWVVGVLCIITLVGALPLTGGEGSLLSAFQHDEPATIPLAQALGQTGVTAAGLLFSICAIFTSYLATGSALTGFWRDLAAPIVKGRADWPHPVMTFVPPLLVVLVWPDLFLTALNVAGGLGLGIFIGLAPALVLLLRRPANWRAPWLLGAVLFVLFALIIMVELGQEMGLLRILPQVEYWTSYQAK